VGYQNQIHAHAWDFTDAPLANKVFLGNQLNEDGIQLKWVAPTFILLGRRRSRPVVDAQFPAATGPAGPRNKNGVSSGNVFTHVGGDLGNGHCLADCLSYLSTSPRDRTFDDPDSTGTNRHQQLFRHQPLVGARRHSEMGAELQPDLHQLQAARRILQAQENGNLTYDATAASLGTQTGGFTSAQSGFYLQGVYQFVRCGGWAIATTG